MTVTYCVDGNIDCITRHVFLLGTIDDAAIKLCLFISVSTLLRLVESNLEFAKYLKVAICL